MAHVPLFRSRSGRLIALLFVMLAVAGAIGLEAARAAAAERKTAEAVLTDYAGFAAWEYARVAGQRLQASVDGTITRLGCAASTRGVEAALGSDEAKPCNCGTDVAAIRTFFQHDTVSGTWRFGGVPLSDDDRRQILSSANPHMAPEIRVATIGGRPSILAWKTAHNSSTSSRVVRGYVVDATALRPLFAEVAAKATLLPATLLDRAGASNVLSVQVLDTSGAALFATAGGPSRFAGQASIGPAGSGLNAVVTIAPEAASRLIIGGMPRERLPWLYGLLGLAALLVGVAVIQLRRESELADLRANFISGVSHELRTPLAQIRMFAETLLLGRVRTDEEARRSLEIVLREASRLSQLADNVLCFERTGRQSMTIDKREMNLTQVLHETAESFEPFARARSARIRVDAPDTLHAVADPDAIRQIVVNLIDNALKYGPPNQIIAIGADVSGTAIQLRVDDEGPGVPEPDRPRIWDPFWRASGTAVGGSGIGLSIVRDLTALHGGRAHVETAPSGGARFVIELPDALATSALVEDAPHVVRKSA